MRSEKEIRELLEIRKNPMISNVDYRGEIKILEWVLSDDKKAVVCPLLADVRELLTMMDDYNKPYFNQIKFDDLIKRCRAHFR